MVLTQEEEKEFGFGVGGRVCFKSTLYSVAFFRGRFQLLQ